MEKKINIPEGVTVNIEGLKVKVSGNNAELEKDFNSPIFKGISIERDDNEVKVSSTSDKRKVKSEVGCIASLIDNMLKGAKKDFVYKMKVVFMHFPMTVKVEGNDVIISNFLGERAIRKAKIVGNTKVYVKKDLITVTGPSKEDVGQTCANIERATRVPARDRRVYQDGIFLVSKE